jgi:hypothetical protein
MITRNCIICWKQLRNSKTQGFGQEFTDTPSDATIFTAYGNYGSKVFDSFGDRLLEVSICDQCLLDNASGILHGKIKDKKVENIQTLDVILDSNGDGR